MATMTLYMAPDCKQSQSQKDALEKSGNTLSCKNLIFYNWSKEELIPFVRGRDPLQMLNSSAPQIRKGEIDPLLLTFDEALDLMVQSPNLIKGPLVKVDNLHIQGSNDSRLQRYLKTEKRPGREESLPIRKLFPQRQKSLKVKDYSNSFHSFWGIAAAPATN